MSCRHHNAAYLYPNNMLSDVEKLRFEAHLRVCDECKIIVCEENQLRSLYLESAGAEPPPGLEEGVFRALKLKRKTRVLNGNGTKLIFTRRIIPAAALLAAALFFIILISPMNSNVETGASSNVNYASIYMPNDDQFVISEDGDASYNVFLSSLSKTDSFNESTKGM